MPKADTRLAQLEIDVGNLRQQVEHSQRTLRGRDQQDALAFWRIMQGEFGCILGTPDALSLSLKLGSPWDVRETGGTRYATGSQGERATIGGALHFGPGRWPWLRGLVLEVATTNECNNPSFETNTTNWASACAGTVARTTNDAHYGTYSLRCSSGGGQSYAQACYSGGVTSFSATDDYALSASYRLEDLPPGSDVTFLAWWMGGANPAQSRSVVVGPSEGGGWHRVSAVLTPDYTDRTSVNFYLRINGATADGQSFLLDAFQIEQGQDFSTSYCDGDQGDGYSWSGTAHASTSSRTASNVDLANYVPAISGQNTLSFRLVAQVQYANDATWPGLGSNNVLFGTRGADNNNRIFLYFDATDNRFEVYLNGATRLTPTAQSFSAGEWFDIVLTFDFTNDRYRMYINGELVATNTNTLSSPTLTSWRLGSSYAGTAQAGVIVAEYMFIDTVLTEQQITALYALHRPLTDAAALFHPPAPGAYKYDVSNDRVYYMTPSGPMYASLT